MEKGAIFFETFYMSLLLKRVYLESKVCLMRPLHQCMAHEKLLQLQTPYFYIHILHKFLMLNGFESGPFVRDFRTNWWDLLIWAIKIGFDGIQYNPLSANQTEVNAAFEIMLLRSPYWIESKIHSNWFEL
jgi:hypothetical protein